MAKVNQSTIGQIVANDYRAARIFEHYGLEFCCGGNKTLEEASVESGVNSELVKKALAKLSDTGPARDNYKQWPLPSLANYIVDTHHQFTREKLPEIAKYIKKVADVHGHVHPELNDIYYEFNILYADMIDHLDEEETILFPYIERLVEAGQNGITSGVDNFGMGANPIAMLEEEHTEAGQSMAKIRRLSNDFTPPEDACATYRILFEILKIFEQDLHKHVHLENNILFPKTLKLERHLHN